MNNPPSSIPWKSTRDYILCKDVAGSEIGVIRPSQSYGVEQETVIGLQTKFFWRCGEEALTICTNFLLRNSLEMLATSLFLSLFQY